MEVRDEIKKKELEAVLRLIQDTKPPKGILVLRY